MDHPPDYHIHSTFSCDSDATLEQICQSALHRGVTEIAITDHADFEPLDSCCDYLQPSLQWKAMERCRAQFAGELTIRIGVECGEAHVYHNEIGSLLSAYDYDIVLGSVHWVGDRPAFDEAFFDGLELEEGIALYFTELARLAADGDFDVLAHADFVRRAAYLRYGLCELDLTHHETQLRAIMQTLVERGKGLEVNTSTLRRGIGDPGPPVQILRWYREAGGQMVTIGSDAHRPGHVGTGFERALEMIREAGFEQLATFHRRRVRWQTL